MTEHPISASPAPPPTRGEFNLDFSLFSISGKDAESFLHRLLSNEIRQLAPGEGTPTCLLSKEGRIQLYFWLFRIPEGYLALVTGAQQERFFAELDRYLFTEQVLIEPVPAVGPSTVAWGEAAVVFLEFTRSNGIVTVTGLAADYLNSGSTQGWVLTLNWLSRPSFLFWPVASALETTPFRIVSTANRANEFHQLRIQHGTPWPDLEINETVIPVECGLEGAASLTKGCYVGQEVIARLANLGQPPRFLRGLILQSDNVPTAGSPVKSGDVEVGKVLSSTRSLHGEIPIALSSIRRKFADSGTELEVDGKLAFVSDLPFNPAL